MLEWEIVCVVWGLWLRKKATDVIKKGLQLISWCRNCCTSLLKSLHSFCSHVSCCFILFWSFFSSFFYLNNSVLWKPNDLSHLFNNAFVSSDVYQCLHRYYVVSCFLRSHFLRELLLKHFFPHLLVLWSYWLYILFIEYLF